MSPGDVIQVVANVNTGTHQLHERIGVVKLSIDGNNVQIEFPTNIGGHNCGGHCEPGYGWTMSNRHVRRLYPLKQLVDKNIQELR